jgi:tol-pal system protein YbgF
MRRSTLAAVLVLVCGCAHAESAAERHRAEMSDELTDLQASQDKRIERLGGSEASSPRAKGAPAPGPRAVQLGDSEPGESDDPNDPNARPEIKVTGTPTGRTTRLRTHEPDPSAGSGRADPARVPAVDPDARKAYEGALTLVGEKKYDKALEALSAFLVKWPDHPYVENATYWRGECYYAQGQYQKALEQFEAVATKGLGAKAPDALLKMGMSHDKLGAPDRAREAWDKLRREHPKSEAARKIPSSADSRGPRGPKESR